MICRLTNVYMYVPGRTAWNAVAIKSATGWWWRRRWAWARGRTGPDVAIRSMSAPNGLAAVGRPVRWAHSCRHRSAMTKATRRTMCGRANRLRRPNASAPPGPFRPSLLRSSSSSFFLLSSSYRVRQKNQSFQRSERRHFWIVREM